MAQGIPAKQLSDDDLRHELLQLKIKQDDIAADGTPHQQANPRERTAELEAEFVRRFGSDPDPHPDQGDRAAPEPQPGIFPGAGDSQ